MHVRTFFVAFEFIITLYQLWLGVSAQGNLMELSLLLYLLEQACTMCGIMTRHRNNMGFCVCCAGMLENDKTQFKGECHAPNKFADAAIAGSSHSLQNESGLVSIQSTRWYLPEANKT